MPRTGQVHGEQSLDAAMEQINKKYGPGSIMRLDGDSQLAIEVIPTGAISLDIALGIQGYPRGRIVEIYGAESSGKTTLALHAVAECQQAGGSAAFIDAEHALDPEWAARLGVDTSKLLLSQPDTGEQALEIAEVLAATGQVQLIVIDSVAALAPRAEIEGEMGDSHVGLQARLMSQGLRKLTSPLHSTGTTAIFINQLREKIGIMFGNPETTSGGRALKFYASIRLDVRRIETLKNGTAPIGSKIRVTVVKNKMASPFHKAEFDIMYGTDGGPSGISRAGCLVDAGVTYGVLRKNGTHYFLGELRIGQGREQAKAFLTAHTPESAAALIELDTSIRQHIAAGTPAVTPGPAAAEQSPLVETGALEEILLTP